MKVDEVVQEKVQLSAQINWERYQKGMEKETNKKCKGTASLRLEVKL